jgi:hypothetical protein
MPKADLQTHVQLQAAIAGARISEPARVAGVLAELRIEAAGHLGRLDLEERSELMVAMRGAGVQLGDRNKLRLLSQGSESFASTSDTYMPVGGSRRVQDSQNDEGSASRPPVDSANTEARERTKEQESNAQETRATMLGVSGDSESRNGVRKSSVRISPPSP